MVCELLLGPRAPEEVQDLTVKTEKKWMAKSAKDNVEKLFFSTKWTFKSVQISFNSTCEIVLKTLENVGTFFSDVCQCSCEASDD